MPHLVHDDEEIEEKENFETNEDDAGEMKEHD